jgi:hypothetical protein
MFTLIEGLPAGAIGVEAKGQITRADRRKVLEPELKSALSGGERIRLLYVAGPGFEGYEEGAALDEAVFGTRHFTDFEKIAFVADKGPFGRAVDALEGLMPAAVRTFSRNEVEAAKAWLAE